MAIYVALRKESVDRNDQSEHRARPGVVALRKESVDRNLGFGILCVVFARRSPQGERG